MNHATILENELKKTLAKLAEDSGDPEQFKLDFKRALVPLIKPKLDEIMAKDPDAQWPKWIKEVEEYEAREAKRKSE